MKEKYAVVMDDEKMKTAGPAEEEKCPRCWRTPRISAGTRWCPECGTEPFEKKPAQ